jgi:hypothetical protein
MALDERAVRVVDVATGREVRRVSRAQHAVYSCAFSPDRKRLATGGCDSTIVLWDLTASAPTRPGKWAGAQDLERLWRELADEDAAVALRSICAFAEVPGQAVPFLKDRLRPAAAVDRTRLARLVGQYNGPRFREREAARQELEKVGELAEIAVLAALRSTGTLEERRRFEALLAKIEWEPPSADQRQAHRAIEALEMIGTPAACAVLRILAGGSPEARLTEDAVAALSRLRQRSGMQP